MQSYVLHEVLKQYNARSKVENSLKFLKDPLFVSPVFLKKPDFVRTLAYVLLMALLIAFGSRFKVPRVLSLAGYSSDIYLDVKEQSANFT